MVGSIMARVGLLLGPFFYRDDMLPMFASIHCELDIFGHCVDEIVKLVGHRSIPCQHLSNLAGNSNSASMLEKMTSLGLQLQLWLQARAPCWKQLCDGFCKSLGVRHHICHKQLGQRAGWMLNESMNSEQSPKILVFVTLGFISWILIVVEPCKMFYKLSVKQSHGCLIRSS